MESTSKTSVLLYFVAFACVVAFDCVSERCEHVGNIFFQLRFINFLLWYISFVHEF